MSDDKKEGTTIELGKYPQTADGKLLPITWKIIHNHPILSEGKALLISEKSLFSSFYADLELAKTQESCYQCCMWENSVVRHKLNQEFLTEAFSEYERALLCDKAVGMMTTVKGVGVQDKVFLLSEQEVNTYLPNLEDRKAAVTAYAIENTKPKGMTAYGYTPWWILPKLDDQGIYPTAYPQAVYPEGELQFHGRNIYHGDFVVRPCILLDLEAYDTYQKIVAQKKEPSESSAENQKHKLQPYGPQYYQVGENSKFVFKVIDATPFLFDHAKKKWIYDQTFEAEWSWGSYGCKGIIFEDHYEMETTPEEEKMYHIRIGRKQDCEICLDDKTVSRYHASLWYLGNRKWYVSDLGSTNGIFLNGEKVTSGYFTVFDKLRIGASEITYERSRFEIKINGKYESKYIPTAAVLDQGLKKWKKSCYLGCLLGGAVGDALGYPVEFQSERILFNIYGKEGIQQLGQDGTVSWVSDDTQMTLFAANGILYNATNTNAHVNSSWHAYREWLGTQGDTRCMEPGKKPKMWIYEDERLHALRAPGNTCLNALRSTIGKENVVYAENNSKGCGTVMRAAPFGLRETYDSEKSFGSDGQLVYLGAKYDAMLTHGHPYAAASSIVLADMIYQLVQRNPQRNCLLQEILVSSIHGEPAFVDLLTKALQLAVDASVSDLDGIHALGEGWVAEEALAIALFCAVRYQNDFAKAIRTAVNHKGDSDSTGAICGNILGAWLGKEAVENAFDLTKLELVDVITEIAEDLYRAVEDGVPKKGQDPDWDRKYRDR